MAPARQNTNPQNRYGFVVMHLVVIDYYPAQPPVLIDTTKVVVVNNNVI
jgi:hypothetical protein